MTFYRAFSFVFTSVATGLAAAFLLVLLRPELVAPPRPEPGVAPVQQTVSMPVGVAPSVSSYADAVAAAAPAVVNVFAVKLTREKPHPLLSDPLFQRFFGQSNDQPRIKRENSLGSGVIFDPNGFVLTNNHVIGGASEIRVVLGDGRQIPARIVGVDPDTDLAVLQIGGGAHLPVATLGQSEHLRVGDVVLAIGNPYGIGQTVTSGIVSATGRATLGLDYEDFIQTDASINPGNSGGPLLNILGEVIGINTAIYSQAQGIGFAIPADRARRVVDDLITFGEVQAAWFGLEVQDLDDKLARYLGYEGTQGVLVTEVYPGSPAEKAGIEVQDILVKADQTELPSSEVLSDLLRRMSVNDDITFRVFRKGKFREKTLISVALPEAMAENYCQRSLGIRVGELTNKGMIGVGIRGVEITEVTRGSQAERVGLQPGDVLLKINDRSIPNVKEFRKEFSKLGCRSNVTLQVLRGRFLYYLTLDLRPSRS